MRLRDRLARRDRVDIRLAPDELNIICMSGENEQRFAEKRPLEALDVTAWEELAGFLIDRSARIILHERDRLCLMLDLPRRTGRNLPAAIALQLGFVSPIKPDQASWSWTVQSLDGERVTILIALARSTLLDSIEMLFARHALSCPPIFCETAVGLTRLRDGRRVLYSLESRRNRRALIASAGILLATPVLLLVSAQLLGARADAQLSMLRRELAPRIEADRQARREVRLWQAYAPLRRLSSANIILGDLGHRVPAGTSIETITVAPDGHIRFELAGAADEQAVAELLGSSGLLLLSAGPDNEVTGTGSFTAELP